MFFLALYTGDKSIKLKNIGHTSERRRHGIGQWCFL